MEILGVSVSLLRGNQQVEELMRLMSSEMDKLRLCIRNR